MSKEEKTSVENKTEVSKKELLALLKAGKVEEFNARRPEGYFELPDEIDLSNVNLPDVDLSHLDLYRANLSEANLSSANLSETRLYQADLTGTNLQDANLTKADLQFAILRKANLSGANLTKVLGLSEVCELGRANFDGAKMSRKLQDFVIAITAVELKFNFMDADE